MNRIRLLINSFVFKQLRSKPQNGFSLLEMALVLIVVGLLLGGALIPLSIQMEKKDRDATKRQLVDMRDALTGFALINGRLPCPDTNGDGVMDGTTSCTNVEGGFPWADLGLGREDAWGRAFTYRVSASFADTTDGTGCLTPPLVPRAGVSFSLCSPGDITVLDSTSGNLLAAGLPAILISHGKNWAISTSVDETENTDADGTMVDRTYSTNATSTFDDLLIWLPPTVLKSNMVSAGLLP